MADGTQHLEQIMENTTRFDLDAAIKSWRQEINGELQLTAENCRELDAHLTDTIRELQKRGLSDEESFWLARRRVGNTQQVAEEFAKADPAKLWRERVFWMACAVFVLHIWQRTSSSFLFGTEFRGPLHMIRMKDYLPDWVFYYLPNWVRDFPNIDTVSLLSIMTWLIPFAVVAYFVRKGHWKRTETVIDFLFKSRGRFVVIGIALSALLTSISAIHQANNGLPFQPFVFILMLIWDLPPVLLIAWLMPVRDGRKRTA